MFAGRNGKLENQRRQGRSGHSSRVNTQRTKQKGWDLFRQQRYTMNSSERKSRLANSHSTDVAQFLNQIDFLLSPACAFSNENLATYMQALHIGSVIEHPTISRKVFLIFRAPIPADDTAP